MVIFVNVCIFMLISFYFFSQKDKYTNAFKDNGFDNTMMISGMTEKELKDIGIETKGTRHKLLQAIQRLTDFEIIAEVPVSRKLIHRMMI